MTSNYDISSIFNIFSFVKIKLNYDWVLRMQASKKICISQFMKHTSLYWKLQKKYIYFLPWSFFSTRKVEDPLTTSYLSGHFTALVYRKVDLIQSITSDISGSVFRAISAFKFSVRWWWRLLSTGKFPSHSFWYFF